MRGERISVDSMLFRSKAAAEPEGTTLNQLSRKRYGSYRDASTVLNKLMLCGMTEEKIIRDERHIPRVIFAITAKGRAALQVLDGWSDDINIAMARSEE